MTSDRFYQDISQFEDEPPTNFSSRRLSRKSVPNGADLSQSFRSKGEIDGEHSFLFDGDLTGIAITTGGADDGIQDIKTTKPAQASRKRESPKSARHSSLLDIPARVSSPADRKKQAPASAVSKSKPLLDAREAFPRPSSRSAKRNYKMAEQHAGRESTVKANGKEMPDFFSYTVFQVVLHSPAIAHQLLLFGQSRLSGEGLQFLAKLSTYYIQLQAVSKTISEIHRDFLAPNSPNELNLSSDAAKTVNDRIQTTMTSTLPKLEFVFAEPKTEVEALIFQNLWPQFVKYQLSVSAARALGSDRGRYAGLGDCFVLTDPGQADNPIVFASDGFTKVTGWSRHDLIPRNCRFLQSELTEQSSIRRIKEAVDQRKECVELFLNQSKSGQPFWNLLLVTPLFDASGKLVYYLGGQINCSTTIHSTSDVLRILAQSSFSNDGAEESRPFSPQAIREPFSRTLSRPFRSGSKATVQQRAPGMEDELIAKLGNMPLDDQFQSFYNAYSNFLIFNATTYVIAFCSHGILELLFPLRTKNQRSLALGTDIFKFLSNHSSSGAVGWDFKASVKSAVKSGQPITVQTKLCAQPSMKLESFLCHYTPLKDLSDKTVWVVLTLGLENRA